MGTGGGTAGRRPKRGEIHQLPFPSALLTLLAVVAIGCAPGARVGRAGHARRALRAGRPCRLRRARGAQGRGPGEGRLRDGPLRPALRYVWLPPVEPTEEGQPGSGLRLVNLELVRTGLAEAVDYPPDTKYSALLHAAEAEARAAGYGLWTDG